MLFALKRPWPQNKIIFTSWKQLTGFLGMLRPTHHYLKNNHTYIKTHFQKTKTISYRVPYEGYPKVLRGGLHSISWLSVTHGKQQKTNGALLKLNKLKAKQTRVSVLWKRQKEKRIHMNKSSFKGEKNPTVLTSPSSKAQETPFYLMAL